MMVTSMENIMIAGIAIMVLASTGPAAAYHTAHMPASNPVNTYTIGLTDLEVFCESYGFQDSVYGGTGTPATGGGPPHGGINGLCFMSSNVDTRPMDAGGPANCRPGTYSITDPFAMDDCAFGVRSAGTFTTFHLVQVPLLPDAGNIILGSRAGNVFFTANPGGFSEGLFAGAGSDGACVSDHYSDVGGQSGGHVLAFVPTLVVFFGSVGSVPIVVLNALPGDAGTYTTVSGPCAASLSENVGGLGVFYVNPVAYSGLYLFEKAWEISLPLEPSKSLIQECYPISIGACHYYR
jgi:hypothetical protein